MPFKWWGRVDCEDTGVECTDAAGITVECRQDLGSHHVHPNIHMNTVEMYQFFEQEFGFNVRQTVTIMGAHTIGTLSVEVSRRAALLLGGMRQRHFLTFLSTEFWYRRSKRLGAAQIAIQFRVLHRARWRGSSG